METNRSPLNRSWQIEIPGHGQLTVQGFYLEPTYRGFSEGNVFGANRAICSKLRERAGTTFYGKRDPNEIGVYFEVPSIEELKQRLPGFLCMALVRSAPIKDTTYDEDTLWSEVVCCWFTNSISQDINSMIISGIRPFAWEKFAKNDGI